MQIVLVQVLRFVFVCAIVGPVGFFLGQLLPRKKFNYDVFPFRCYAWERNGLIYQKVKIQVWKDKLPDMSKYVKTLFGKRIPSQRTPEFFEKLIIETCIAELVHVFLILASPIFLLFMEGAWGVGGMIAYALGNVLFIMVQRYNRPRLKEVVVRQQALRKRRQERQTKGQSGLAQNI